MKPAILCFLSLLLIFCSCKPNRKEISDSVFLEKENGKFNLLISLDEEGAGKEFYDVDSLAIDSGTAFLIYCRKSLEAKKEWIFYGIPADGAASPEIRDRFVLGDKRMHKLIKSSDSWWNQ